jgi:hypothetical protein
MLTKAENAAVALLRYSITGEEAEAQYRSLTAAEALPLEKIISINGILPTVYPCLDHLGPEAAAYLRGKLRSAYYSSVSQSVLQDKEGKAFLSALSAAGFDAIPLKGWLLRKLYPDITRRSMADLDILVRNFDYGRLEAIALKLGYTSSGDTAWKHVNFHKTEDDANVEVHRRLTDESGAVAKWEKDIFSRAVPEDGEKHIFRMSDEDFYIFHMLHLLKDFGNGKIGLRRIADTWLYLSRFPDMNGQYLEKQFADMDISAFVEKMETLADVCFGGKAPDEDSELLIRHACNFGIFGTVRAYKLGRIARMSKKTMRGGKLRSAVSSVFLPYGRMKAHYPVLKKAPILLPYCWCCRIARYRHNLHSKLKRLDYSDIDRKEFDYMKKVLRAGGLKV